MESIIRNVKDIPLDDRRGLEHVVGRQLLDNQQIIIQVMWIGDESTAKPLEKRPSCDATVGLPEWCNVYEGLSDKEIAEVESVILDRSNWSRPSQ